jgi:predicted nucleic acid-binding protein
MTIELIYWDSDAFLGWLQEEPGKVELCDGTLTRVTKGEVLIVTSALTIAEVLWMRGAPMIPVTKAELVRKFFRRSYIRVRNVTRAISEDAQDLVWSHSIRPKDAIHVATALDAKVPFLETFDDRLLKQTGTVGDPPLVIRRPIATPQGKLGFPQP